MNCIIEESFKEKIVPLLEKINRGEDLSLEELSCSVYEYNNKDTCIIVEDYLESLFFIREKENLEGFFIRAIKVEKEEPYNRSLVITHFLVTLKRKEYC